MINHDRIVKCIHETMEEYYREVEVNMVNWHYLINASERVIAGEDFDESECPSFFLPNIKLMKLIMKVTREGKWDWSDPKIQKAFQEISDSEVYRLFARTTIKIAMAIIQTVEIGTLVEVGTGPGQVTRQLCQEMVKNGIRIPLIISDRAPGIASTEERLSADFPQLAIRGFIWDIKQDPPRDLMAALRRPVFLFERFCIPYGGYNAIHNIAPIADIMLMVEDLNLSGKRQAYDIIFEKIGLEFFTFEETLRRLEKHFSLIHTCDARVSKDMGAPVTDFTLAIR